MQNKLKILLILGTGREGRKSEIFFAILKEFFSSEKNVVLDVQDARDFAQSATIPAWEEDARTGEWKAKAREADAYIIVLPEYNHGYPGELKVLLDAAYVEYNKKPVLLCAVSSGAIGGARAVENIKPVLLELGMVPTRMNTHVFRVGEYLDEKGEMIEDKKKDFLERFGRAYGELLWLAQVLREGRENYPLKDK